MWLEIFVFLAAIVAGTGLGGAGQFAVACYAGLGVVVAQHIVVIRWLAEPLTACGYQPLYGEGMVAPAARAVHHQPLHIVGS